MRLVGEVQHEARAFYISNALSSKRIEHRLEVHNSLYQIWIVDEDRFEEAKEIFLRADPTRIHLPIKKHRHLSRIYPPFVTLFFLFLCTFIFVVEFLQPLPKQEEQKIFLSPVQKTLLFDLPKPLAQPQIYGNKPYWQGLYEIILLKGTTGDASPALGPLFIKIRQGELWRLFTPCLLHGGFLHILFNMIWLWILGRPIEQRIGALRMLLFTVLIAIATNTVQYLISGPLFLGYSGVIMGLAGFTYNRERIAPWEGYPLNRSTILFLALFVVGMLALQLLSFFIQLFTNLPFILNIANAAHIFGALFGFFLAFLPTFAQRAR